MQPLAGNKPVLHEGRGASQWRCASTVPACTRPLQAGRRQSIMWHLFMSLPWPSRPTGEQKLLVRSANICAQPAQQAHAHLSHATAATRQESYTPQHKDARPSAFVSAPAATLLQHVHGTRQDAHRSLHNAGPRCALSSTTTMRGRLSMAGTGQQASDLSTLGRYIARIPQKGHASHPAEGARSSAGPRPHQKDARELHRCCLYSVRAASAQTAKAQLGRAGPVGTVRAPSRASNPRQGRARGRAHTVTTQNQAIPKKFSNLRLPVLPV
jgi:hypothetical protein